MSKERLSVIIFYAVDLTYFCTLFRIETKTSKTNHKHQEEISKPYK